MEPVRSNKHWHKTHWSHQLLCEWSKKVLQHIYVCSYCAKKGTPHKDPHGKSWHMDHVIPYGEMGTNTPSNIVKSCSKCNSKKSNKKGIKPIPGSLYADGHVEPYRESSIYLENQIPKAVVRKERRFVVHKQDNSFNISPIQMERVRIIASLGGDSKTLSKFEEWFK